jgi:Zn-dependent membrane protease YugP
MPFMYYYDPTYILVIIGLVISLAASARVRLTFNKYSRVRSISGLTGAEAAERILARSGIYDVKIERAGGMLSDHYDPRKKVLRLSDSVYGQNSVAAVGVAAHECGHALQHHEHYAPLMLRSTLVPVASFGSFIAWPLILIGLLIGSTNSQFLIDLGIILFSAAVLLQLITLPVEFNASRRAVARLGETGILYGEEIDHTKKVLNAAALTYVAAAAASILQLLRLFLLFGGRRRD